MYRFGIIVSKRNKNIGLCSCGQALLSKNNYTTTFQCDNCGNDYFVNAKNQSGERFVIPYLEALRKDNRGFKVKRVNLSVIHKDGCVTPVKENLARTIEYDIVDKVLKVWRGEELEYDFETLNSLHSRGNTNRMFFTQLDEMEFLKFVGNEVTRDIYEQVVYRLSDNGWKKKNDILKGLAEFMNEYSHLQILANAGIPKVDRFYGGRRRGYYGNRSADNIIDETKTKPHEILKVPKFVIPYVREDVSIDRGILNNIQGQFKNIDNNKFREIMSIVKDEGTMRDLSNSIETIMQIHMDYDYSNLKKLVLYLFREVRLTQGIESPTNASTYLRDYIRMSRHMGLEFEKYPKSLKKVHDVVQMNYNVVNAGKEKQALFKLALEKSSYQKLKFLDKKEKFAIIVPEASDDLVKEGNQLSHCVASYVKDVMNDKCKILFLRDKEEIEKPMVTIEVRGFNIRQAKGFANRAVTKEQMDFIKLWAEKKNLIEAYY